MWSFCRTAGLWLCLALCSIGALPLAAQPLQKSAIQVDPGNTKQIGASFGYRLTYNCSSTSGPCLSAQVVDLLPPEVAYISTVPASATGDVAGITVTPNFGGSGRTRVLFTLITPLPAGNSGDLIINVRFPNGSTPNGTVAINSADGINLGPSPGTFTTPAVNVTAVGTVQATLAKTLQTSPANLDLPESYRLRISVSGSSGSLNLTAVGPVVDTLPPGTVFNGSTPAADCQPGCVGTTPATLTWTSPCTLPLTAGSNCDITVNVTFPSATFPSGTNVTNSFTTDATALGQPPQNLGVGTVTHPVTTFVPAPGMGFSKNMAGNTPNPPTLNQTFSYDFNVTNNGNVVLDNPVIIDTLPIQFSVLSVTTGAYNNLSPFAVGEGVRVSYEKNTAPAIFTLWGSSPNVTTNTTLTAPPPGLGVGEYITRIRWEYGQAAVGMGPSTRPIVTGRIINPDNAGAPVAIGNSIQNCGALSATYTAGPTAVTRNDCETFVVSGPFVQLNPAKDNLSGGGPFNPGQTVAWRLRVRTAAQSSDPVPLDALIATDLLPVNLNFVSWTFDDQASGLPAPQVFDQIPNFANTGRTLLRWRWNAGSGNLGVNAQVFININTTIRNGTPSGSLSNDFTLDSDAPGLGQRCSTTNVADTLDYDADADTAEQLCRATGTITVAGIAQLISSKTIQGTCDGGSVASSLGTLHGGAIDYTLRVQNVGTVAMQNFVLIDILPFVGDTGVRDTNPRGSLWTPLLAAPITPPAGTTLYYSTSGNPCRGEVGGPTTSCDAPNWTTVPPVPITSVRSYKIEFGSRVVQPFDFLSFNFLMVTPGSVPAGQLAFNSFAYQADRSDGLGSLAAEPQKVGISIGACEAAALGDYVWADANSNGQQDDGPTGINGVPVFLWQPGVDGIAGSLDDIPVAQSITGQSPTNAPGWYSFPGLAPGSYFVCIAAPPTFVFSPRDQGADTIDSDANPATGCAPNTVLGANQINPTIDFGIVPTQLAALGDYVWFDRNSNGTQTESPFDGANGVSVRLWIDDGDSVAEPGTGDVLAATTVTDNDLYGAPGYYLFDGLIPGVRYYVQFIRPAVATAFTAQNSGADDSIDSDADLVTGVTAFVVLAPSEVNRTVDAGLITATGTLALGDQVWNESDNDGLFEPQNGELGVDGVRLDLYRDVNNDNAPTLDEYLGTTNTATSSGFAGRYRFSNLAAGNYIVVVAPQSFSGSGSLYGRITATGNDPAPDPDNDFNGDDNGTDVGALIGARPVTLVAAGEPTTEDGDNTTNLTVDFGFIAAGAAVVPEYDYGDAPDVIAGTANGDYNTTVLDTGAYHRVPVAGAPFLGSCVDADDGFNQNTDARADDSSGGGSVAGTCAQAGDDEDGVSFVGPFVPGAVTSFSVNSGGPSACVLNAWVDWNRSGVFGDSAGEQIATDQVIATGPPAVLNPTVPLSASPGRSYARFRCASSGGLTPTGAAANGEVEDYVIGIQGRDFPDAPNSYQTQGAGAAQHLVDPLNAIYLGQCVDFEADGQPNVAANGDDLGIGTDRVGLCQDDEDGVVFNAPLVACNASTPYTVTASAAARLDGWIDFNRDGSFGAGEQIAANQALTAGANALSFAVACGVSPGPTYARFRISSVGGLGAAGSASNGEVEDYAIALLGNDYGDAPAPLPTLFADNGARHAIDPASNLRLGACVDTELNGQPNAAATGDDSAVGSAVVGACSVAGDDEDGVTRPPLIACRNSNLTVNAGAAGVLDAWVDFNRDGDWADAGERITSGTAVVAGANSLNVAVPCNASRGLANLRFRLSSSGVASFTGAAPDGEVEDYQSELIGMDLGDLPDAAAAIAAGNYRTLLRGVGDNGPQHRIVSGLQLGATVDNEVDGQPGAAANGDDTAGAPDDEDGITMADLNLTTGLPASVRALVTNTTGNAGRVCGFADLNADGDFQDANETAFVDVTGATNNATVTLNFGTLAVNPAVYNLTPPNAARYFRFRLADNQNACVADNDALPPNGEVEDYVGNLFTPTDFGDLPDTGAGSGAANYETLLANGGPYHPQRAGLQLGACVDAESNGLPGGNADDDDLAPSLTTQGSCATPNDDEDGLNAAALAALGNLVAGGNNVIAVLATNTTGSEARLCGFIDFNADGDFADAGETQAAAVATGSTNISVPLTFPVPVGPQPGSRYARFRLSTDTAGNCAANGAASDGEVEDYRTSVRVVDLGDLPDTSAGIGTGDYVTLRAGGLVAHTIDTTGSTLFLGAGVDAEGDGQPTAGADGDDLNADDEDGLIPNLALALVGTGGQFAIRATNLISAGPAANLCAYADWNGDGDFADTSEFTSTSVANGSNNQTVFALFGLIPAGSEGQRYLRLRYSTASCASQAASGGALVDGEVEDYRITVRRADLGDLPDTATGQSPGNYFTRVADSGAAHGIEPGLYMGACVDAELDGQPNATATGDDAAPGAATGSCAVAGDDEDGVNVADLGFVSTLPADVRITVTNTTGRDAQLCGMVDWNGDGDFADTVGGSAELSTFVTVPSGSTNLVATVSFGITPIAPVGASYARFRFSTQFGCSNGGNLLDGEVEDYAVSITRRDFGDLPDTAVGGGAGNYQTLLNDNGAAHDIVDGLYLGALVDPEGDGVSSVGADGDDLAGQPDDEDGVNLTDLASFHLGSPANLRITATNTTGTAAQACGFIDWNRDGDFADTRETASVPVPSGSNAASFTLSFGAVPAFEALGQAYARIRLQNAATPCAPAGLVNAGEVEDYTATVLAGEMSLGNLVWQDRDNNGSFGAGELPFDGIAVDLFRDANDDGTPDGAAIASQTTAGGGLYLFGQLVPDTYLVCINAPVDWISSSGNGRRYGVPGPTEPGADPDNDANDDDNGSAGTPATRICSRGVTLSFQGEPTNDGDASNNSNLSVDFGLVYNFDLALRKQLSPGQDVEVDFGDTVSYTITLYNQGTVTAQNIVVTDTIPTGMQLDDTGWTAAGNLATRTVAGPLAPGGSTSVTLALRILNTAVPGALRNVAEISAAQDSSGQPVPSILDRDSDPDGNAANDPEVDDEIGNLGGDEDDADPASVNLGFALIGVAKQNLGVQINTGNYGTGALAGTASVRLHFTLRNYGTRDVSNVSLIDALDAQLPPAASVEVRSLTASGLNPNPAYNAAANTELLAAGQTLAAGATATVDLEVLIGGTFPPYGVYTNLATLSAIAPGAITLTDTSTDGANPDPDGDNDPTNNQVPTPIDLSALGSALPIPALDQRALLLLVALVMLIGLRRRQL